MLKEYHKTLIAIRILLDIIIIIGSWLFAYYIRFKVIGGGQANLGRFFINFSSVVAFFYIYSIYKRGLYASQRFTSWRSELFNTFFASFLGFSIVVMFSYFIQNIIISRLTLGIFLALSTFSLLIVRIITRNILLKVRKRGRNLRYIMVVGFGEKLDEYLGVINKNKMGVVVTDIVNPLDEGFDLLDILTKKRVDQIVVSIPGGYEMVEATILKVCSNQLIPVIIVANIPYSFIGSNVVDFRGVPILEFNNPDIGLVNRILKRSVDVLGGFFGLLILSPLFLILGILVKATSKGPIFYGQERMTRGGKSFIMWKFRSMKVNAENIGDGWTVKDDPRRTVIGPFLRSSSLDELPQLWNVFIGQMSLVGPRPERPVFIDKFKEEIPAYMLRHKMKAGITGWAQINGWRGDTSIPKRIESDLYYIKNWSLVLDIKILLLTFVKGFIDKNAY